MGGRRGTICDSLSGVLFSIRRLRITLSKAYVSRGYVGGTMAGFSRSVAGCRRRVSGGLLCVPSGIVSLVCGFCKGVDSLGVSLGDFGSAGGCRVTRISMCLSSARLTRVLVSVRSCFVRGSRILGGSFSGARRRVVGCYYNDGPPGSLFSGCIILLGRVGPDLARRRVGEVALQ